MFQNSNYIEGEKSNDDNTQKGFISTIFEFLYVIFRLSLLNFDLKQSKYTLDKTFDDYFKKKIKDDDLSFKNFICNLSDELKAIQEFLDSGSNDKDFKSKDLNLDILISCVNNCFLFCVNKISYEELVNSLKCSFQNLIKKKKILLNKESKVIISSFNSNIDMNLNYINKIKDSNYTFKKLEEKEEINIQQYLDKVIKLEKEVADYKIKLEEKEKEIQDYQKKNEELNFDLSQTKINSTLDKSAYEEIKTDLSNKIIEMLNKHSKEIELLNKKINNMEEEMKSNNSKMKTMEAEIKDLKKENIALKSKVNLGEKKLERFQALMTTLREDIKKDFSNTIAEMLNKHSKEIKELNDKMEQIEKEKEGNNIKMKQMEKEINDIKKENNALKSKLNFGERKLKVFQDLMNALIEDVVKLSQMGNDLSNNLNEILIVLDTIKYKLDTFDIDLDNLRNTIG